MALHDELIKTLKIQTPVGQSSVAKLMDMLQVSKEGAYRRLRGEIQLTLDEAVILAKQMGVSLDNMIEGGREDLYAFHITPFKVSVTMDEYYYTLMGIMHTYDFIKNDPEYFCYIAGRVFSPAVYFKYKAFTRFTMFKWIYQVHDSTKYSCLSAVELSPEFEQMCLLFHEAAMQIPTTYIINELMFSWVVHDLSYYYDIKLLTREEVEVLKSEVLMLIDDIEEIAAKGSYPDGAPVSIYISDLYFDSSYYYTQGGDFTACAVGIYGLNFLSCRDPKIVADHKAWIESMIEYSTLITHSGEMQRTYFFNRQREKINALKI